MTDTTWHDDATGLKRRDERAFSTWFDRWFVGSWEPSADGAFQKNLGWPEGPLITSCKECGALVLHNTRTTYAESVRHLNAHRSWHDKINNLLSK